MHPQMVSLRMYPQMACALNSILNSILFVLNKGKDYLLLKRR